MTVLQLLQRFTACCKSRACCWASFCFRAKIDRHDQTHERRVCLFVCLFVAGRFSRTARGRAYVPSCRRRASVVGVSKSVKIGPVKRRAVAGILAGEKGLHDLLKQQQLKRRRQRMNGDSTCMHTRNQPSSTHTTTTPQPNQTKPTDL